MRLWLLYKDFLLLYICWDWCSPLTRTHTAVQVITQQMFLFSFYSATFFHLSVFILKHEYLIGYLISPYFSGTKSHVSHLFHCWLLPPPSTSQHLLYFCLPLFSPHHTLISVSPVFFPFPTLLRLSAPYLLHFWCGDTFFQSMSIILYSFAQCCAVLNTTFRSSELQGNCAKFKYGRTEYTALLQWHLLII